MAYNPFVKSDDAKYIPECHIVSGDGKILATIGPENKSVPDFGASYYCENFRDEKLKINDDRKIKLTFSDFTDINTCILLTVRVNDVKKGSSISDYN